MASSYLNRTQGTPTSRKTFTYSAWIKISELNVYNILFESASGSHNSQMLIQNDGNGNDFRVYDYDGSTNLNLRTSQAFRDVSAWYHIVLAVDTTQATASNRAKLYVNGEQVTSFSATTYPSQNYDTAFANGVNMQIGRQQSASDYFNGLMTHIHFIDGLAYDADTFGETDATTGIWIAKTSPSVTYGNNGFFLKGENSGALGTDSSGNGNNFTVNGTPTQTIDTPSNVFATMNPLSAYGSVTLANGNTQVNVADNTDNVTSNFMVSSGKWYWEGKYTVGSLAMFGIRPEGMNYNQSNTFNLTGTYQGYYYYADSGNQRPANTAYGNTFAVNDIIGIALDLDNNKLYFSKNGVFQNSGDPTSGATGTGAISIATSELTWGFSFTSGGGSDTFQMNFGNGFFGTTAVASAQNPDDGIGIFEYDVPTGYRALCTKSINAQEYS